MTQIRLSPLRGICVGARKKGATEEHPAERQEMGTAETFGQSGYGWWRSENGGRGRGMRDLRAVFVSSRESSCGRPAQLPWGPLTTQLPARIPKARTTATARRGADQGGTPSGNSHHRRTLERETEAAEA